MNSLDRFSQSAAEDMQAGITLSGMDAAAEAYVLSGVEYLKLAHRAFENAAQNSSVIQNDATDTQHQIADILAGAETMQFKIWEAA